MPENRFFLDSFFQKEMRAILEGEEFRHLKVMRKNPGDTIELVNGKNQLSIASLTKIDRNKASLLFTEVIDASPPPRQLILVQALLRPKNLELVIEKGTELGATAFWLFPGDQSEKKTLSDHQLERLKHLTISALKQCGRLDLPKILLHPPLDKWEIYPPSPFFGDPKASKPLKPQQTDSSLIIGPEKGFSLREKTLLNSWATPVRLNPNILRAETAAIAALSLTSQINR